MKTMKLTDIRLDGGTQSREKIYSEKVNDYAESMQRGAVFLPVTVFFDGTDNWLADGFHRYFATKKLKKSVISVTVINGTVRDAILHSKDANALHGMPMTRADKRKNCTDMLNDFEWGQWSDVEIARKCDVSQPTVSKLRKELGLVKTEIKSERNGQVYTQKRSGTKTETPQEPKAEAPKHDKAQETIDYLMEENEKLSDQLAVQTAPDGELAEMTIKELREEVKLLRIELRAVKTSRDTFQNENAQLKKQIAYYQKEMKKVA